VPAAAGAGFLVAQFAMGSQLWSHVLISACGPMPRGLAGCVHGQVGHVPATRPASPVPGS